jgi:hypothetical protein
MPAPRATTKHDVALAEVERKLAREVTIARGLVLVFSIVASSLPILALQEIVTPLAGHTTQVNVNLAFSFTVAVSVVVNIFQAAKTRSQRHELERQRERVTELEGLLP